jgi:hypothetical protein
MSDNDANHTTEGQIYPCPACGFLVFSEPPGSFDVCPFCGWEDDHVQLAYPWMRGGANSESLQETQQRALQDFPEGLRELDGVSRDPTWRPLRAEDLERQEKPSQDGMQYIKEAIAVEPEYYWKKG